MDNPVRYFMRLAYRGAPFHGWQTQPGAVTVQEVIEEALSKVLRTQMKIVGAGRTDAGVNARTMIAHFDTETPIADTQRLIGALNSICGPDIAIYDIYQVDSEMHARFSATKRTYHYYASEMKSPFFYPLCWKAPANLDYTAMNRAAELLLETEDFTSFSKLHTDAKTNICHVTHAAWHPVTFPGGESAEGSEPDGWVFVISADRFLRNMVRAVVGTLVEVGRGKITVEEFGEIIAKKDRCAAGTSMPGHALYLWDVEY